MRLDDYPTPAQTKIYIGRTHVDDAARVQFEVQHPRIPLYGYNNEEFAVVADGKVLVTGNLVVNYRMPGYLLQAINNAKQEETMRNIDIAGRVGEASTLLPHNDPDSPRLTRPKMMALLRSLQSDLTGQDSRGSAQRLMRLAAAMRDGTLRETSALMKQMLNQRLGQRPNSWFSRHNNPALGPSSKVAFDIQIAYGDNHGPVRVDMLEDCYITGMGKAMSASAGGGGFSASGMPIYEIYPFIARTMAQYIVEVPNDPSFTSMPTGYEKLVRPSLSKTTADFISSS